MVEQKADPLWKKLREHQGAATGLVKGNGRENEYLLGASNWEQLTNYYLDDLHGPKEEICISVAIGVGDIRR